MTRLFCAAFGILVLFFLAFYPMESYADPKENRAYERIKKTGVLRCGYASFPPYMFIIDPNTKEMSGIVPTYMDDLAKNLGIKIEYVEDAGYGPQAIEGLKTGRFDAFCTGFNINAPRGREIFFTLPIWKSPVYAYVRHDDKRFDINTDILDDPQYTISVMDGEASDTVTKNNFPRAKTFAIPQMTELSVLYSNVSQKKADAVFSDAPPVEAYIQNNPNTLRRANDTPVIQYVLGFGVSNTEPKLRDMLNAALIELHAAGRIKAAIKKYDPDMVSYQPAQIF